MNTAEELSLEEMLTNPYSFQEEDEIILFFNRILLFMVMLFDNTKEEAVQKINQYYEYSQARQQIMQKDKFWKNYKLDWIEDLGHEESYLSSFIIQHHFLPEPKEDFFEWRHKIDKDTSPEFTSKRKKVFDYQNEMIDALHIALNNGRAVKQKNI
ncbi:hypothetical protein [Spirosoma litoris]